MRLFTRFFLTLFFVALAGIAMPSYAVDADNDGVDTVDDIDDANPFSDTDGDGLSDLFETLIGTTPVGNDDSGIFTTDNNGNNVADIWENQIDGSASARAAWINQLWSDSTTHAERVYHRNTYQAAINANAPYQTVDLSGINADSDASYELIVFVDADLSRSNIEMLGVWTSGQSVLKYEQINQLPGEIGISVSGLSPDYFGFNYATPYGKWVHMLFQYIDDPDADPTTSDEKYQVFINNRLQGEVSAAFNGPIRRADTKLGLREFNQSNPFGALDGIYGFSAYDKDLAFNERHYRFNDAYPQFVDVDNDGVWDAFDLKFEGFAYPEIDYYKNENQYIFESGSFNYADNALSLTSVTVELIGAASNGTESLSLDAQLYGISNSFDAATNTLTITITTPPDVEEFQQYLRKIRYQDTGTNTFTERTVRVTMTNNNESISRDLTLVASAKTYLDFFDAWANQTEDAVFPVYGDYLSIGATLVPRLTNVVTMYNGYLKNTSFSTLADLLTLLNDDTDGDGQPDLIDNNNTEYQIVSDHYLAPDYYVNLPDLHALIALSFTADDNGQTYQQNIAISADSAYPLTESHRHTRQVAQAVNALASSENLSSLKAGKPDGNGNYLPVSSKWSNQIVGASDISAQVIPGFYTIQRYLFNNGAAITPSTDDYTSIGIPYVRAENIDALNAAMLNTPPPALHQPDPSLNSSTFNFDNVVTDISALVTYYNDLPEITNTPISLTLAEDTFNNFTFTVADNNGDEPLGKIDTVRLQADYGNLTLNLVGTSTISAGANMSTDLSMSGDLSDLNATLANNITYTPPNNFAGIDTINITVTDAAGVIETRSISLTVTPDNDPPSSANVTVNVIENGNFDFVPQLFPFSDLDNAVLASIIIDTLPTGSMTLNSIPVTAGDVIAYQDISTLQYQAGSSNDALSFKVNDGSADSIAYQMNFNVLVTSANDSDGDGVDNAQDAFPNDPNETVDLDGDGIGDNMDTDIANGAPQVSDDTGTASASQTITLDPLANDTDLNGDSLSISSASSLFGSLTVNPDQSLSYVIPNEVPQIWYVQYQTTDDKGVVMDGVIKMTEAPVTDDQRPVFGVVNDIDVNATGAQTPLTLTPPTATDVNGNGLVVRPLQAQTTFSAGTTIFYWEAIDYTNDTKRMIGQRINVNPQVQLGQNAQIYEGGKARFKVYLSGKSPTYPITLDVEISGGTADSADHNLASTHRVTFTHGLVSEVVFDVLSDGIIDADETIELSLATSVNRGATYQQTLTIKEGEPVPHVGIKVEDSNGTTQHLGVSGTTDTFTLKANVLHPFSFAQTENTWRHLAPNASSPSILGTTYDDTTITVPTSMAEGLHVFTLNAKVVGSPLPSIKRRLMFKVIPNSTLGAGDLDLDGTPDATEGNGDTDGDLIPDFADVLNDDCSKLPMSTDLFYQQGEKGKFVIQAPTGTCMKLGQFSQKVSSYASVLSASERSTLSGNNDLPEDTANATAYAASDVTNFTLTDLVSDSVTVVIPQKKPIQSDTVLRKYTAANGWFDFKTSADEYLRSAQGKFGECPPPHDAAYTIGLTAGHYCIEMTILDGGVHDGDGEQNGSIDDPNYSASSSTFNVPDFSITHTYSASDTQYVVTFDICNEVSVTDCSQIVVDSYDVPYQTNVSVSSTSLTITIPDTASASQVTTLYLSKNGEYTSTQVTINLQVQSTTNTGGTGGSVDTGDTGGTSTSSNQEDDGEGSMTEFTLGLLFILFTSRLFSNSLRVRANLAN